MAESRLSRRTSKQGKKQLYWSIAGIVLIIFIALNFGPTAIAIVGNTIDTIIGKGGSSDSIVIDGKNLRPPMIDTLPQAVSEPTINITGLSYYNEGQVELFVNDIEQRSVKLEGIQEFEIKNVELKPGVNILKTRFIQGNNISGFSEEYRISFLNEKPELEISFPEDGQSFEKSEREIQVSGKTESENSIRVNDFIAIVDNMGNFSYQLRLSNGENIIKITAENPAGQKSEKEIKVSYSD